MTLPECPKSINQLINQSFKK